MQTKPKKDLRIDEYIKNAPPFAKPILKYLRKIIRESCPQSEETIRWGAPWFTYMGKVFCGIVSFKAHCALLFNKKSSIIKDLSEQEKMTMAQLRHITKIADLPSSSILKSSMKHAMKFNEPGAKLIKRKIKRKAPVKTPSNLMRLLRVNSKALASYEAFTQSNKRHYVEWIAEAKTETTRGQRLEKAIKCIAAGKTKHWD
jgi:uncharacterized protein YdeI (YjbR/CyaY-like superfamily)